VLLPSVNVFTRDIRWVFVVYSSSALRAHLLLPLPKSKKPIFGHQQFVALDFSIVALASSVVLLVLGIVVFPYVYPAIATEVLTRLVPLTGSVVGGVCLLAKLAARNREAARLQKRRRD